MTAEGDPRPTADNAVTAPATARQAPVARRVVVMAVAGLVAFMAACTSDRAEGGDPAGSSDAAGSLSAGRSAAPDSPGASVPSEDEQAIRATIDRLNATASGPVADQRSALAAAVDPALIAALDQCPNATTTLRFEPVYRDLREAPGWAAPSGELAGTVYALPALVRIFTGDRITGTDLTTLHLGVQQGEAFLTPLCIG